MPIQGPQWTEFLACPVCYNGFNNQGREPVSLGCGHSICKSCLSRLSKQNCPFDQTEVTKNIDDLPCNYALLQLVGQEPPDVLQVNIREVEENHTHFELARKCIECLGLFLAPLVNNNSGGTAGTGIANGGSAPSSSASVAAGSSGCGALTRPMQRKLVTLVSCQLAEEEGRCRALRAARSLGERAVKELILLHQNPQQLSANLWSAVRARGCQFLGPAMQEEVLRLILLALEEGNSLCRKVLVLYVVQRLENQFTQASKTSIGHVVQLLYRASCFKVTKREGDSSLLQLQERYRTYSALRKEHDAQIVQIATEAGLHISPEQWSALLYGDDGHKSHMQSIIDKLQTPASFGSSIQELIIALQRTGDPANLQRLRSYLELLADIDPNPEGPPPPWKLLSEVMDALKIVVYGLVDFVQNHSSKIKGSMEPQQPINSKYKTHMCRDIMRKGSCPRGNSCSFAHSSEELERYGRRRKNLNPRAATSYRPLRNGSSSSPETVDSGEKTPLNGLDTSASDKECSEALPDEGASGFRRINRDNQQSLLLQEAQSGIRNLQIRNPTQYTASYAQSYTFTPAVHDRSTSAPSPLGYMSGTMPGNGLPNGGLHNGFYHQVTPPPPPPVNGIAPSFGRPDQVLSPGIQSLPVTREPLFLNSPSEVPQYYDVSRPRTESFPPAVMPGGQTLYFSNFNYMNDTRYSRPVDCPAVPSYGNQRLPYSQLVYGSQTPDNFPAYGFIDSRSKGARSRDIGMPFSTGGAGSSHSRSKAFRDDFPDDCKSGWPSSDSNVDNQGKPELVSKFAKFHSLGSCADTSSSSYDYSSDTFSPLSSGSSHQGSPPASQISEFDSKIWEPYSGDRGSGNVWGPLYTRCQWPKGSFSDNWTQKHAENTKNFGALRDVWNLPSGSNRLQQSYDEDFIGLNRSLLDQEDPSNTSCESNVPSLPEVTNLEKEEANRSFDNTLFNVSFMKQQGSKPAESGMSLLWGMNDQDSLSNLPLDDELSFTTRAKGVTLQKTVAPPPGINPSVTSGVKPIGFKSERYRGNGGPMTSSETTQGNKEQSLTEIENLLNNGRSQQVSVNYGNYSDLIVHE